MAAPAIQIIHEQAGHGQTRFVLKLDGKSSVVGVYGIGNEKRRTETAKHWYESKVLTRLNGDRPSVETLAEELEAAELDALDAQAKELDKEGGPILRRASYVDDEIIAELGWNTEAGVADFIVYRRATGAIERCDSLVCGIQAPPWQGIVTPGTPVEGSILVCTEADPAGEDEAALRHEVRDFIHRYVELPGDAETLAVEYVMLTWVHDGFEELPYLAFRTADCGRGKSRALEAVGAICYRPLYVGGGSSSAAVLRLLDSFGGTLVADEFDNHHDSELTADIIRILNQGFQRRRPLLKCCGEDNEPKPFRCYGPKVFALRKRLGDDATESRTISIKMEQRTRRDIPLSLPRSRFDGEALAIRNKLLAWRFKTLGTIAVDETLADPSLEDRGNQIGLPLLALARTPDARWAIVNALHQQQSSTAEDRAETWGGEVFGAILRIGQEDGWVRPADVAAEINKVRAADAGIEQHRLDRLGKRQMTKEQAGRVLRQELELPKGKRDGSGVRYILEPARMTQLAQRFGTPLDSLHSLHNLHLHSNLHAENGLGAIENAESVGSVGSVGSDGSVGSCGNSGDEQPPGPTEADAESVLADIPLDAADLAAIRSTEGEPDGQ